MAINPTDYIPWPPPLSGGGLFIYPPIQLGLLFPTHEARWSKEGVQYPKAVYGSPDRPLKVGALEIPCYVLDDGRRVITQAGMLLALGMSSGGATKGGGDRLTNFVSTKSIKPFISDDLSERITNPLRFRGQGGLAYAYEAIILPDVCDAVHPVLTRHLYELIGMMRVFDEYDKFYKAADHNFPKINTTMLLPYPEGEAG